MLHRATFHAGLVLAGLLAGCAGPGSDGLRAVAELKPASGSQTHGTVWFAQEGDHVVVRAAVSGLTPAREHGFHVHEIGDCGSPDAKSAGEHFNPGKHMHGAPAGERHAGDLPSLKADSPNEPGGPVPGSRPVVVIASVRRSRPP